MEKGIVIVAETGSDIPAELAREQGIVLVPMHVTLGDEVLNDGEFPAVQVCEYYERAAQLPKTSASSPYDFEMAFDWIHKKWPKKQILHLAYSAVTTAAFGNARLAAMGREYVHSVDTKQVSGGQAGVVLETARLLEKEPDIPVERLAEAAREISGRMHMCFIPDTLDYLRAGGRVSNAAAMLGNLLGIHPCIRIQDGKLLAKEKYRGTMKKIVGKVIRTHAEMHHLDRKKELYLLESPRLAEKVREAAVEAAGDLGFHKIRWIRTGCVITSHSGPGSFGVAGFS